MKSNIISKTRDIGTTEAFKNSFTVYSISDLQSINGMKDGYVAFLSSGGRSGTFIWTLGDFTDEVSADTQQGIYIPANSDQGGLEGCWVRSAWDSKKLKSSWFGNDAQSAIDLLAYFYDAASGGTSGTAPIRGVFELDEDIDVSAPIEMKPNIDHEWTATINVLSNFVPDADNAVITGNLYNASFNSLKIVSYPLAIYGYNIYGVRVAFAKSLTIGCQLGNKINGGYGNLGFDVKQVGINSAVSNDYAADAYGFENKATDSKFYSVNSAFFQKGVHCYGNTSRYIDGHCWSLPNTVPMKVGWDVENEGTTLIGCIADTPTPDDTGVAPSLTNGGYGFLNRSNAADTSLIGCEVISSEQTGNVDSTVIPYKLNKEANLIQCKVRNFASTTNIFIAPFVQFISHTIKQLSAVLGGNVLSSGSGNMILPGSAPNMTNSIDLEIGGVSGATFNNSTCYCAYSKVGMFTQFFIKIKLSSKNSLTGDVTITGLPFTTENGYGDNLELSFVCNTATDYAGEITALLTPGTTTMQLVFTDTRVVVTDADILDTTEFTIVGQVLSSDGFFDDVD